ncbi:hypothetical protein POSPLADRAFT_1139527 [Postia placenta MAD-698-R-SB12]|uniref:SH3 domain-containing protein n=1 Tax=Postia placenta MAD-698-R-SB12 TaxID=670580 RepID=A0A1X6N5A8_9APHY|nr:hypothetical protein POSPLADRAFT_1139527 [Postia placenta MAD-698-R-SB12]OSX63710.1 hypothetical protein POSPLADRAFT_1139527 [Postia placenta MAD-698-R-SB12]
MKLNTPLPQPLPKECSKAANIFKSFVDSGNNGLDGIIPRSVLHNAKGFAIFTIFKAGFLFSARAGTGVVIARLEDGTWSAPSAIGTAGLGVGGQAGAEMTDFLVVLNSRSKSFMSAGSLTLGGNLSIAVGPLGRNGEAIGSLNTSGKVAAMYSYSKTRGLFGGVSIEGSVIVERQDANAQAYHGDVSVKQLLSGAVPSPEWAQPLIKTLEACTGMPGNRPWIQDFRSQHNGHPSYAFGGDRPDSLSKTKKSKSRSSSFGFPPASWGKRKPAGSYFEDEFHDPNRAPDRPSPRLTRALNPATGYFDTKFKSDFVTDEQLRRHPRLSSIDGTGKIGMASGDLYSGLPVGSPPPVKLNSSGPPPRLTPKAELTRPLLPHEGVARAIALYNFDAVQPGDLSFKKGQVITVTEKSHDVNTWWRGKLEGREGIFPANFVEVV